MTPHGFSGWSHTMKTILAIIAIPQSGPLSNEATYKCSAYIEIRQGRVFYIKHTTPSMNFCM